ncbi:MAG: aldehyde dehydrogenase family protein, partial [Chloroflexota bacterium]
MATADIDRALDTQHLDSLIAVLHDKKDEWATLPIPEKMKLLLHSRSNLKEYAQEWVDASVKGKRIPPDSPWVGEEWTSGPWAIAAGINAYLETLESLAHGKVRMPKKVTVNGRGRTVAHVYPSNFYATLITNGVHGEVWMQDGVTPNNLEEYTATFYNEQNPAGKVALVLGAGNINSIAPLDVLYKLIADGEVALLKLNPVNDYLGPILLKIFAPFVEAGYFNVSYGGGDVGAYLTNHPDVDSVHITGSGKTYDIIMYGPGEEGAARKAANDPVFKKEISSELGGVTPIIVVPGDWSDADIRFQAERIVTAKLHNAGCNCVAAQVIITDKDWDKRDALMAEIQRLLESIPPREAYYPGAGDRIQRAQDSYPEAVNASTGTPRILITDLDASAAEACFTDEYFTTVLGETPLTANSPADFLRKAVVFANEQLEGTLGASILVDPKTAKALGSELENAIDDLRYGAIAINLWSGVAFLLAECAWGGVAGQPEDDVQSGIGFVHNAYLFDKVEKSVVRGSFYSYPRGWL